MGKDWIVRTEYSALPNEVRDKLRNGVVYYAGFDAYIGDLIQAGWCVVVEKNLYTGREYLVIRYQPTGLVGRGELLPGYGGSNLRHITTEKNQFIDPPKIIVQADPYTVIPLTSETPRILMELATEIMSKEVTPKPRKKADIYELEEVRKKYATTN